MRTPYLSPFALLLVVLLSTSVITSRFLRLHRYIQDLNRELIRINHDLIDADLAREASRRDQERLRADLHDALGAKLLDLKHLARAAAEKLGSNPLLSDLVHGVDAAGQILRRELVHQEDVRLMRDDFAQGIRMILLRRYSHADRPLTFEADDLFSSTVRGLRMEWTDMLYPAVQELASNDLKYGRGPARWKFRREEGNLVVELVTESTFAENDGKAGLGTSTLTERLKRAGGSLHMETQESVFRVRLQLPIEAAGGN